MKLAFCLYKYFPFGGLQRDFLRIAQACQQKGYEIYVFTMAWTGDIPAHFQVTIIPVSGFSNHQRCARFAAALPDYLIKAQFDAIIGFNRLPNLDIYFAADVCYEAAVRTRRSWFYRLTPRYKVYAELEKKVFEPASATRILLISAPEQAHYQRYYGTQSERFQLLPPGIAEDRKPLLASGIKDELRHELGLPPEQQVILMVGSSFDTKGVDRALQGVAALPAEILANTSLLIVGKGNAKPYIRLAKRLGIVDKVKFLGPRHDIPRFLAAANILLHPAYVEAGGMVLLEALVSGLPVLATSNCGYAYHIAQAEAGIVLAAPFQQEQLNQSLTSMLDPGAQAKYQQNALAYARQQDFYQLTEKAVEAIEKIVQAKGRL